ncbi:MAG: DUF3137 domain-containing protein [Bacteroidales bacterium]|nr:DUF3137 domain-containing protein [Bacteroidales bacterium]
MALFLILSIFIGNKLFIVFCTLIVLFFLGQGYESISKTILILRREYKNYILPVLLNYIYSDFEYIPEQKISKKKFEESLLFPREIETIYGEDFMRFRIDNVGLMFCESIVYGYIRNKIMFKGIFIAATFNKSFSSKTFVFPEKTTSFYRRLKFNILGSSYKVHLEDPEFEKEFIVLSEDQVEARYLLTTNLMQRMLEYKRKLNAELAFSFISNRLYCTIPNTKNLFEPAIFNSFLDFDFILKSYEPIILYTSIVKDLKLNLSIWKKE